MDDPNHYTSLDRLEAAADQASAAYHWEAALKLYRQALESSNLPPQAQYRLWKGVADCNEYLGDTAAQIAARRRMIELADSLDDPAWQAYARQRLASNLLESGEAEQARQLVDRAYGLARQGGDMPLLIDCSVRYAQIYESLGEFAKALQYAQEALQLSRQTGLLKGEVRALAQLRRTQGRAGAIDPEMPGLDELLEMARRTGERYLEVVVLNEMTTTSADLAQVRSGLERILEILEQIGLRSKLVLAYHNMGWNYTRMGLYRRAIYYLSRSLPLGRHLGLALHQIFDLIDLAEAYAGLEDYRQSIEFADQAQQLAQEVDTVLYAWWAIFEKGIVLVRQGRPDQAKPYLQQALEHPAARESQGLLALAQAWLGAAEQALGQHDAALAHTAQAALAEKLSSDYPPQSIFWWRYRVLSDHSAEPEAAWQALERARKLMLEGIASTSDEGLRRNYLNKIAINREITLEWTRQAALRNISLAPFLDREHSSAGLEQQIQRMVATGNRLTGLRSQEDLLVSILDEFVELSGAERAFILLHPEQGPAEWAVQLGIGAAEKFAAAAFSQPFLQQGLSNWQPLLRSGAGEGLPGSVPELDLRTVIVLPMVSRGRLWGLIYGDMRQIFGRFTHNDLLMVNLLANQAAAALENADWSHSLEQKVAARTAELQAANQQIQHQRQYFESVVQNSPAAIVTVDMQGRCLTWNLAAQRLFGYTPQEALGHDLDDLVAAGKVVRVEARRVFHQVSAGERRHLITRRLRKDGSLVDVELFAAPVIVEGEQIGTIAIYHDITELMSVRREAEAARQAAEAANHAKSAFLANMSHELRTPLNAILGFTRIVRRKAEGVMPEKQLENLDKVLLSGEHLLGLINTILDIAKIEAGRTEVQPAAFDMANLVGVCLATAQPLFRPGVTLVKQVDADLPQAFTDQGKVRQVLLNLLSNAAKFTHAGQVSLSVTAKQERFVIRVSDSGIGIPADRLEAIFDEFQQVDSTTTRQYGGTGLGLAISRKLGRLLGGDLTATSEFGQGSTFEFEIPVCYGSGQAVERTAHLGLPIYPVGQLGGKPLVLAVDDDPNVLELLRQILVEAGYQMVGAATAESGLQKARELKPFAITLDVMMPDRDGWQVLYELKADPATREIPVILLTVVDNKALGYQLGATDYLLKPFDELEIQAALQRLIWERCGAPPGKILVVDDDPNIAVMIRQLVEENGCNVAAAGDGLSALELIARDLPDVILLDLMMPNLDGFGLLDRLQADSAFAHIPVIVLTAKSLNASELELLQSRATSVIQKQGLSEDALVRELHSALPRISRE